MAAGDVVNLAQGLVFTPNPNTSDPLIPPGSPYATFTFQVKDNGLTANGGVDTDQTPNTFTFHVTHVHHAPSGTNASIQVSPNPTARVLSVSDFGFTDNNDTPHDSLSAVIITNFTGTNGTLKLNGNNVTFGTPITLAQITGGQLIYTPNAARPRARRSTTSPSA